MAPKLYGILASPPVRAVLMCAKELDIELEFVTVMLLEQEHLKEDFLKKNPQHTVPVLEDEDGFIVSDSHAIMGYLVSKYGKNDALYPKNDFKKRATIDHMLHFDSGILFNCGLSISKPLVFRGIKPTQDKLDALKDVFKILNKMLEEKNADFIAGNSLSIADFSVVTSVTSWNFFVPYSDFPNLKGYVERVQKLNCYEENKEGLAQYDSLIAAKLKG